MQIAPRLITDAKVGVELDDHTATTEPTYQLFPVRCELGPDQRFATALFDDDPSGTGCSGFRAHQRSGAVIYVT